METLRLAEVDVGVTTLGPGPAVGIWVQGCAIGCAGCMSPHTHDPDAGALARVDDVARWLDGVPFDRLTISGGEPFEQAPALARLIRAIRSRREWTVTCFTGITLERLEAGSVDGATDLLAELDLLVDGPYRQGLHAPLLWRGSSNQRIHDLSRSVALPADEPAGVEVLTAPGGGVVVRGVPPVPGVVRHLGEAPTLAEVRLADRRRRFPFPTEEVV